jgi:hypothetical protein
MPRERRVTRRSTAAGWLLALAGPFVVSGGLLAFRGQFDAPNAALVLVLVVLGSAILGGRRTSLASAAVSAACFDFFFTHPYYRLTIARGKDIVTTILLFVVATGVGELVAWARRSEESATTSRHEVERVRLVAEIAAGGGSAGRLVDVVQREVVALLGGVAARFERPPFDTVLVTLAHDRTIVPAPGGPLPAGPTTEMALPVWGRGRELGRLVVVLSNSAGGLRVAVNDRLLAVALVDQLGAVLAANGPIR